jgi:phosphopantothenoylcysteine synthetase/decarboxylase
VERAVRVYYDSSGRYPKSLQDLLESGVLTAEGATDPYGRPYRYILRPEEGKFRIYGRDAQGDIDLDLSFERSLAPVAESKPGSSPGPEKQPGVRVVK